MKNAITNAILDIHKKEWNFPTIIPQVRTFYRKKVLKRGPQLYQSSIIFISSWRKNLYLNDKKYSYWDWEFLLMASPTPIICEAEVDWDNPFVWVQININKNDLYGLIKEIKWWNKSSNKHNQIEPWILPLNLNKHIYNALLHLLECCKNQQDAEILWPSLIREIMYYALQESDAEAFCDMVLHNKNYTNFWNIVEEINTNYNKTLSIESMANKLNMSESTFFRQFKAFTWYSPNQYIKDLRLNKAKIFLITNWYSVKQAAKEVWYTSQSQFSREYKRYFWYNPVAEWR